MSKETGKWLPYELNSGKAHDCKDKDKDKKQQQSPATEITLAMVQKKLESIGIIINVNRLMKE